jgi:uncharacterized protein (TIGR00369 family)
LENDRAGMSDAAPPLPGFLPTGLIDPFELYVGPVFESGQGGARTYAFRVDTRHVNRRGVLHGGMFMTLADMTLGQAVWDATDKAPCVTLNMQSHFLKPAREGDIVQVTPDLIRRTGGLVFMRGDFTVDGTRVFTASSVWKLLGRD